MLSKEDSELIARTGPGTPMGSLLRRYPIPVLLSSELAPGGRVKRVQLLGERLIAYRTPGGTPGLIGEFCAHRGASLYFGRVEDTGMRCVYHGWKYALDGQCLETPNEPSGSTLAARVRQPAYPCTEQGGVIWAYMGPGDAPAMPCFEWNLLPQDHVFVSKRVQDCNWFQALEGGIDSSHISFLHSPLDGSDKELTNQLDLNQFGISAAVTGGDRAPHFEVAETDYGAVVGARRTQPDGQWLWRISHFLLPFHTMPPTDLDGDIVQMHMWIPMDDTHLVNWMVTWHTKQPLTREEIRVQIEGKGSHVCDYAPASSEPYGDIRAAAGPENDYFMDWEAHRTRMFCGIPGFGVQDQAVQESQGAIVDRTRETLGTSDTAIVRVRRLLLGAARALLEHAAPPPGLDASAFLVRSTSALLPAGDDWRERTKSRTSVNAGQAVPQP